MSINMIVSERQKPQSTRRIWTLATSSESGISSQIFRTEREAFAALANLWFPNFDVHAGSKDDISNHTAMLTALSESVEAARAWFEDFQLTEEAFGDAIIESHEIPVTEEPGLQAA